MKKLFVNTLLALLFCSAFVLSCDDCTGKSYQVIKIKELAGDIEEYTFRAYNTCPVWKDHDIVKVKAPKGTYLMSTLVQCKVLNDDYNLKIDCP